MLKLVKVSMYEKQSSFGVLDGIRIWNSFIFGIKIADSINNVSFECSQFEQWFFRNEKVACCFEILFLHCSGGWKLEARPCINSRPSIWIQWLCKEEMRAKAGINVVTDYERCTGRHDLRWETLKLEKLKTWSISDGEKDASLVLMCAFLETMQLPRTVFQSILTVPTP